MTLNLNRIYEWIAGFSNLTSSVVLDHWPLNKAHHRGNKQTMTYDTTTKEDTESVHCFSAGIDQTAIAVPPGLV